MEKQIIDDKIKELFISSRVIALVGASKKKEKDSNIVCLLYTSPSPRDRTRSRMPSSA